MARFVAISLALVFSYCVLQCSGVGIRGFPSSSSGAAASSGCDTRTRLAKLNCSCPLSNQNQNCLLGTNSFCISGKCSCRGNTYIDWSTGFFCRNPFQVTSPRTATAAICLIPFGTPNTLVPYGTGAASQAARFIIHENAAGTVTCTPSPATGTTTKVTYSAVPVNGTHMELVARTASTTTTTVPSPAVGPDVVTFTCVDGRGVTQVVTVSYTVTITPGCV